MRKSLVIITAVPLFALVAAATDIPKMETFLGYNFVRFNPDTSFIPPFNANGGSGQFVYNFNKWIGAAVDAGAVSKGILNGLPVDTTVANFLAGPRVKIHEWSRFSPFFQVLFGGVYATTSTRIALLPIGALPSLPPALTPNNPNLPVTARLTASQSGFAMMAGGGLDIKISKHVAFRPIGVDYYLTRLQNLETLGRNNQSNFRYSGGVNFLFGAR